MPGDRVRVDAFAGMRRVLGLIVAAERERGRHACGDHDDERGKDAESSPGEPQPLHSVISVRATAAGVRPQGKNPPSCLRAT
jgi:hypothetical protein